MSETAIPIQGQTDVLRARQAGREIARQAGFGLADQTRLATAISELARNVILYAGSGVCTIYDETGPEYLKIRVVIQDTGSGIPDIQRAMQEGFSSGKGLGAGLPGTRRLMQEFAIESSPRGTTVTIALIRPRL